MNNQKIPETVTLPMEHLVTLAIEHWRLARWLDSLPLGNAAAQGQHALSKMTEVLRKNQLEARSLDGQPYDPGLAVRVVDAVDSAEIPEGETFILETISPQVLWRASVIKAADIVTVRGIVL